MDLKIRPEDEDEASGLFTNNQFRAFFGLIAQSTELRQLELRQVDFLPNFGSISSTSVRLLRLSGSYSLKASVSTAVSSSLVAEVEPL